MRRILMVSPIIAITLITVVLMLLGPGGEHAAKAASSAKSQSTSGFVTSGNGKQAKVTVVLTWYGFNDNSGQVESQHGAATIAYPHNEGNPTPHNLATEGRGTFHNPITFAA